MQKLTIELNLPTQADIDDFLTATGWKAESEFTKAQWAKKVVAEYVKERIKSKRMVALAQSQQVATEQALSQINSLIIT